MNKFLISFAGLLFSVTALSQPALTVYYDFDLGSTNDTSANSYNGYFTSTPALAYDRFGIQSNAIEFDGTYSFNTPFPGVLGDTSRTITFWTKIVGIQPGGGIMNYGDGWAGGDDFELHLNASPEGIQINLGGMYKKFQAGFQDGKWHQWSVVFNKLVSPGLTGIQIYRDGVQLTTVAADYNPGYNINTASNALMTIGSGQFSLDDFKIYKGAMSPAEVQQAFISEAPINSCLMARYDFSGNANDSHGANNSTSNNAVLTADRFGNPNSAYQFNGSEYIDLPALSLKDSYLTIGFWASRSVIDSLWHAAISQGSMSTNNGLRIGFDGTSAPPHKTGFDLYNNGAFGGSYADSAGWHQWYFVYDNQLNEVKMYRNGIEVFSSSLVGAYNGIGPVRIGAAAWGGDYFKGKLDDIKFFNCMLTAGQIDSIYQLEKIPACNLSAHIKKADITCYGLNDGSLSAVPLNAAGPVTFAWSNLAATDSISGLAADTYSLTIQDGIGCTAGYTVMVGEPVQLTVVLSPMTQPMCLGQNNGSFMINTTGGTGNLTFLTLPDSSANQWIVYNVAAGTTYTTTATDDNGCTGSATFAFSDSGLTTFSINIFSNPISCSGMCDGTIYPQGVGGTSPYTFYLGEGSDTMWTNLCPDTYVLDSYDANGCESRDTIVLINLDTLAVSMNVAGSSCGAFTGGIAANVTGGTAPYIYYWSTGETGPGINGLAAGQYFLQVTDAHGCYISDGAIVADSDGPAIAINGVNNVTCAGLGNGSIDISVSGGSSPYSIRWSTDAVSEDLSNLSGGNYDVVVTDNNGCIASQTFAIAEPDTITLTETWSRINCGNSDGFVSVGVSGGTAPYTYMWDAAAGNMTADTVYNLGAGIYKVTVTDASGCTENVYSTVSEWGGPYISVDSLMNAGCILNGGNGAIYTTPYGTGPYAFQWSNGQTTDDITGLAIGNYALLVTDSSNGCKSAVSQYIRGERPGTAQICMLTVDTATNQNVIVWNDTVQGIAEYQIFRESSVNGVYNHIATVPAGTTNTFVDTVANPENKPWRYEIKTTDSCGRVSTFSLAHKTIHLTVNAGNGGFDLSWDQYQGQGVAFTQYLILRYHWSTGWLLIDSVPANAPLVYTDLTSPEPADTNYYFVEINADQPCNSTYRLPNNSVMATVKKSRSNIQNNKLSSTDSPEEQASVISIYPNPSRAEFNIQFNRTGRYEVKVFDARGRMISSENMNAAQNTLSQLKSSDWAQGIYFVRVTNSDGKASNFKLIKQ